jgi:GT2 family glycosyltransferase
MVSLAHTHSETKGDMKVAVIICSVGRPAILHDTVCSIRRQHLVPRQIIIVSPSLDHVLSDTRALPGVLFVSSPLGSTIQRNRGLESVDPGTDLVAFLDDDMELCASYLCEMARLFRAYPELVIGCGTLLHDGGRSSLITRDQAKKLCLEEDESPTESGSPSYVPLDWAYGCNMMARWASVGEVRFDERLPLYAWLEDSDYGFRCTIGKHGPVTCLSAKGVHLGWRGGRTSGVRFGFSQIVNPLYLWRKAKVFPLRHIIIQYWLRCLAGNILGTLTGDPKWDRPGGLRGNLLGFKHLLSGGCDPTRIVHM